MNTQYCPSCGWPASDPYEIVSRHHTSEGAIVYTRCVCGRLQVRRGNIAAPVMSSRPGAPLLTPSAVSDGRRPGMSGALVGGAVAVAVVLSLPPVALVAGGALFVIVAALAWTWAWLTESRSRSQLLGFALRTATVGALAGLAVGAVASVLHSATVVALALLIPLAGWWLWRHQVPHRRPC